MKGILMKIFSLYRGNHWGQTTPKYSLGQYDPRIDVFYIPFVICNQGRGLRQTEIFSG